jgi:alkylated DNA repair dioxygenase AlkB
MENLLPQDGIMEYYGKLLDAETAQYYFDELLRNIAWQNDKALIFGKEIITKRKVAWYGEKAYAYTYSKYTKYALPFTPILEALKKIVEETSHETYNACLLNLYHNGGEGMAWHSDGEKDLKHHGAIASLSFGAERKFAVKHKNSQQKLDLILENSSLLVMKGAMQSHWLHQLPVSKRIHEARINLTFRSIVERS